MAADTPKIEVRDLKQHFPINTSITDRLLEGKDRQVAKAVDGVSLKVQQGEALGIAGESGCGKTTLAKTAIRLLEPTDGEILFDGKDITSIKDKELKQFRREAQIIHQDPYNSLNPRFTVFKWVKEPLDVHGIGTPEEREERVYETMRMAGLTPIETFSEQRPPELSGGERQRVSIARALVLEPSFIVADEPASMLDVSIRANILDMFERLQEELGLTTIHVSHDLALLKSLCDRIAIMYLGEIVEIGTAKQIIKSPQHPYTKALVSSVPVIDPTVEREKVDLVGEVPDPVNVPSGCRFHPRCPQIVQPDSYDLEQQNWRAIVDLRQKLEEGDIDSDLNPEDIRDEYDLPNQLSDTDAESVLTEALAAINNDDVKNGREILASSFTSPCESEPIPSYRTESGQTAKCVLLEHDDSATIE